MRGPAKVLPEIDFVEALAAKFKSLGLGSGEELNALLRIIRRRRTVKRGRNIVTDEPPRSTTVLLGGVSCWYRLVAGNRRQIFSFQYAGDFCDLQRYVFPIAHDEGLISAITECSVGIIHHEDIEQAIIQYPKLALMLWRSTILDASILRERVLNVAHRTALARIAHIICEQLFRLDAIGVRVSLLPLSQIDVANAAGLSPVHMSRVIRELRRLGALSDHGRGLEVASRKRLVALAQFDAHYLNMPGLLKNWDLSMASTPS